MGDTRFESVYAAVRGSENRVAYLRSLADEDVVAALAGASGGDDPLVANFLATEAMNRIARSRRILDSLPEGVVIVDREGRLVLLNRRAEALVGWLSDEVRGRSLAQTLGLDAGWWQDLRDEVTSTGGARARLTLAVENIAERELSLVAGPYRDVGGGEGVVICLREVET